MEATQQVRGTYMGNEFNGVITAMRRLTVKTDGCFEYMIKLAQPVTVFGTERDSLCLYAGFDGEPSSYTKYTDRLVAA